MGGEEEIIDDHFRIIRKMNKDFEKEKDSIERCNERYMEREAKRVRIISSLSRLEELSEIGVFSKRIIDEPENLKKHWEIFTESWSLVEYAWDHVNTPSYLILNKEKGIYLYRGDPLDILSEEGIFLYSKDKSALKETENQLMRLCADPSIYT